jgi:hypothetical protein
MNNREHRLSDIRRIVAHAIGLTPADMADEVDLLATFTTDGREIGLAIAKIEALYGVEIPADEIGDRPTILSIYRATARCADWLE